MSIAIKVENLGSPRGVEPVTLQGKITFVTPWSKLYRIGERERYLALRDVLTRLWQAPFRWFWPSGNGRGGDNSPSAIRNSKSEISSNPQSAIRNLTTFGP